MPDVHYLADGRPYYYPAVGDTPAPRGTKVLLLTEGGVCIVGIWADDCLGWLPLPTRDRTKEAVILSRDRKIGMNPLLGEPYGR